MFLSNMRILLLYKKLSISAISKLRMKINNVNKHASIERTSIRKNAQTNGVSITNIDQFKSENITSE